MSQKLKVVTIGGGSSYTPELLEGFIKRYHELPVSELWLVDVEGGKAKLDIIFDLCHETSTRQCLYQNFRQQNVLHTHRDIFHGFRFAVIIQKSHVTLALDRPNQFLDTRIL